MRNSDQADRVRLFATAAARFCDICERAMGFAKDAFITEVLAALAELYLTALRLPDVAPLHTTAHDERLPAVRQLAYDGVGARLGTERTYWTIFDPHAQSEPVLGDLADDLADIYWDIDSGLNRADHGNETDDVLWEWKWSLRSHWGRHAAEAMRALHGLRTL
jgi:hypothetical protein